MSPRIVDCVPHSDASTPRNDASRARGKRFGPHSLGLRLRQTDADGPRDALSVEISSTVETRCTTNPQRIVVMELEGHS